MSAPNRSYDPVQVTPLHPDEVARTVDEALADIAAASDLDMLHAVKLAHDGDRSLSAEVEALAAALRRGELREAAELPFEL